MTERLREIALGFLKLGATAYGGPAIMGVMQAEFQGRRQWISGQRFVEGLSLVNMLPGAAATQLGIFLGYHRGGIWGGVVAGLCFVAPGFLVMLALTVAYAALGVSPLIRGALYGLGPVVLGIFIMAVRRLGGAAIRSVSHGLIAAAAALAALLTPIGLPAILLLSGAVGLLIFHSRRWGAVALVGLGVAVGLLHLVTGGATPPPDTGPAAALAAPRLGDVIALFFTIGAFTFGGGLSMVAFLQDHVVTQLHWLTPQEFLDGLALGQLTPGPVLIVAAYVGYKVLGVTGAVTAAAAIFLPSFVMMLAVLPAFERVRTSVWARAAMQGIGPAVIGALAVSLARLLPHAAPDRFAAVVLVLTVAALAVWRLAPLKVMLAGAVVGAVRSRVTAIPALRALLGSAT
jgi:chromate transporter